SPLLRSESPAFMMCWANCPMEMRSASSKSSKGQSDGLVLDFLGNAEDFLQRRDAFEHLANAVVVKRGHTLRYGHLSQRLCGSSFKRELTKLIGKQHQFEDSQPSPVAGLLAMPTPFSAHKGGLVGQLRRNAG